MYKQVANYTLNNFSSERQKKDKRKNPCCTFNVIHLKIINEIHL